MLKEIQWWEGEREQEWATQAHTLINKLWSLFKFTFIQFALYERVNVFQFWVEVFIQDEVVCDDDDEDEYESDSNKDEYNGKGDAENENVDDDDDWMRVIYGFIIEILKLLT